MNVSKICPLYGGRPDSEAFLHRYLSEFDFRYNHRAMSDAERGDELLRGAKGKRLVYQQPREAAHT